MCLLFSCSVLSDSLQPHDCSTPGFPVHHYLPELCVLAQKELCERQTDRQKVDLLIWMLVLAGEGALVRRLTGMHFYNQRKVGKGERSSSLFLSRCQAYTTSSSFVSCRKMFDPRTVKVLVHISRKVVTCFLHLITWGLSHAFIYGFTVKQACFVPLPLIAFWSSH